MSRGKAYTRTRYEVVEIEKEGFLYEVEVGVDEFVQEPWNGSALTCDSDADYYGYTDIEGSFVMGYTVFDHEGNETKAPLPAEVAEEACEKAEKEG